MAYKKILVPLDGSRGAWKAFRKALLMAEEMNAGIAVLSVEEHLPRYAATVGEVDEAVELRKQYFTQLQSEARQLARERDIELPAEIAIGHPAQAIVEYAKTHGFDLIMMGQVGHSGLWGTLLGSTTDRVVDHAPCDVLVVR